jgi:hypothetical protein
MASPIGRTHDSRDTAAQSVAPRRWDLLMNLRSSTVALPATSISGDRAHRCLMACSPRRRMSKRPTTPTWSTSSCPACARGTSTSIAGRQLTVRGDRKEKERVGILRRRERTVGRFQYEVTLPGNVAEDGVTAGYDNGVLTVRAPKPEGERPCHVEVHMAS